MELLFSTIVIVIILIVLTNILGGRAKKMSQITLKIFGWILTLIGGVGILAGISVFLGPKDEWGIWFLGIIYFFFSLPFFIIGVFLVRKKN